MDIKKDLLKAMEWLSDERTREIDVDETVEKMTELMDSIKNDEKIDPQNYLLCFEKRAREANVSFDGLTKQQQLQIAEKIEPSGIIYDACMSNAAYKVFIFAEAGYDNVEQIVEGFRGCDLSSIYKMVRTYHGQYKPFTFKLEAIKDRVLNAEQASQPGRN